MRTGTERQKSRDQLLAELEALGFDRVTLKHRELIKKRLREGLKKPVTAEDVRPWYPSIISDAQAAGLYFVNGIAEILAIETGSFPDNAGLEDIRIKAHKLNTPEMEPDELVDLVLERIPGSATYRSLH